MGTEASHMAYPACEAVMMVHMGTEATHMAYPACEASHIAGAASEAVRAPSRSGTHVDSLKWCNQFTMLIACAMQSSRKKKSINCAPVDALRGLLESFGGGLDSINAWVKGDIGEALPLIMIVDGNAATEGPIPGGVSLWAAQREMEAQSPSPKPFVVGCRAQKPVQHAEGRVLRNKGKKQQHFFVRVTIQLLVLLGLGI